MINEGITPYLKDSLQAWEMQPDGSYKKRPRRGFSAREYLLRLLAAKG